MKSIWKGAIGFGLVNIPVKLYSATEQSSLDLDMIDRRDHGKIRFKKIGVLSCGKRKKQGERALRGKCMDKNFIERKRLSPGDSRHALIVGNKRYAAKKYKDNQ